MITTSLRLRSIGILSIGASVALFSVSIASAHAQTAAPSLLPAPATTQQYVQPTAQPAARPAYKPFRRPDGSSFIRDMQERSQRMRDGEGDASRKDVREKANDFRTRAETYKSRESDRGDTVRNNQRDQRALFLQKSPSSESEKNKKQNFFEKRDQRIKEREREMRKEVERQRNDFSRGKDARDLTYTRATLKNERNKEIRSLTAQAQKEREVLKARFDAATSSEERKAILEEARAKRDEYQKEASAKRDEYRKEAFAKRDEFRRHAEDARKEIKTQRSELRAQMKTKAAERMKTYLERILGRVGNALDTFTTILDRMTTNVTALGVRGVDTAQANTAIKSAQTAVDTATKALSNARTTFTKALESDNPKNNIAQVRTAVKDALVQVKNAHTQLRKTFIIIKALNKSVRSGTATLQPSPTTPTPVPTPTPPTSTQ